MTASSKVDTLLDRLSDGPERGDALHALAEGDPEAERLLAVDDALGAYKGPPVTMGPALQEALLDLRPVTRTSRRQRVLPVILLSLGAFAVTPWLLGMASGSTWWQALPGSLVLVSGAAAGMVLVFYRGADGLGAPMPWRRGFPTTAALLLLAAASLSPARPVTSVVSRFPSWVSGSGAQVLDGARRTIDPMATFAEGASAGVLLAAMVAGLLFRGLAKTTPVSPGLGGANVGLTAGLVAAAAVQPTLDGSTALRLAVLGLPAVLAMVVGSVVGRRVLSP